MTNQEHTGKEIGVAVDVGSTSIGVCVMDLIHKTEILSFSFANPQYIYGADVITRIRHCSDKEEMLFEMKHLVENALMEQLREWLARDFSKISRIVYSGNTTMQHILRGLSVKGLGVAPFSPVDLNYAEVSLNVQSVSDDTEREDTPKKEMSILQMYLPGFSAFVGADILAGATYLQMGKEMVYDLLIDLGTNGELLLINKDKGVATSTACGPVFDHVISGAMYGSDCMRIIANCVRRGLIDSTGKLQDILFDKGIVLDKNLVVRQEYIRNFQLAKGAVYAGIQCVMKQAGIISDDIGNVYISGGFGFYMNKRDAFTLKMIPQEFAEKLVITGNTSLEGAKQFLISQTPKALLSEYEEMRNRTYSFELANQEGFQECFMQSLDW